MPDPQLKRLEYKIKAAYLRLFGLFFGGMKRNGAALDPAKIRKVLFIRPDRLGDTICSLPLIDAVKEHFPGVKVGIIGSDRNRVLLENDPRFDEIYIYHRNILKDMRMALKVRRQNYDCLIDLMADDSATSLSLVQFCSGGRTKIGVGKKKHAEYYEYNVDYDKGGPDHIIDIYLSVLKAFGIDPSGSNTYAPPYIPDPSHKRAESFLSSLPEADITIGFNLSVRLSNRIWGHEKSCKLIEMILRDFPNVRIIIMTAPPDRARGDAIVARFDERVYHVTDGLNFVDACAVISRLDMLITADTSVVHAARSFQMPVLGMYPEFAGIYKQWYPYGMKDGLVLSHGGDDVFNISPEQAFETFVSLMNSIRVKA